MTELGATEAESAAPEAAEAAADCPQCRKPAELCLCSEIVQRPNKVALIVLQHPQEQDRELGSARLATLLLSNARLRIGLSWPNLSKAIGRPADPKRWAVLYLGPTRLSAEAMQQKVLVLDKKAEPLPADRAADALGDLEGVILLDGSWAQAKTLWWRNPWLLKCWRVALNPPWPSRYGRLRKEPRRDSVSTIEAAALILGYLENSPETERHLLKGFEKLLQRYRETRTGAKAKAAI
ncbi:MAG TPA: tRNA-uridine aminocarboxypropyltransferase [Stellaceae bacterium]|jgi:DTW domain-containing protein YfiP|nr:tRNA-uridine aminocarboxypropyltransferase [Stellaceae bacterium]